MPTREPRSFAPVDERESLPEDILYWAALFRATPAEAEQAMEQVEEHPEPEPRRRPARGGLHKPHA